MRTTKGTLSFTSLAAEITPTAMVSQRMIACDEGAIQPLHEGPGLRNGRIGYADFFRNLIGLVLSQAGLGIDGDFVYFLRMLRGDFLDLHAAFRTRHQRDALRGAIDDHADIEFFANVGTLLDQQSSDQPAIRSGLMRDQSHPEDFGCEVVNFLQRLGDFDATALAASAVMNLRLDDPDFSPELSRRRVRLGNCEAS